MESELILEKLQKLPREAQNEALDFIDYLGQKYSSQLGGKKEIDWESVAGLWADSTDMEDSTAWVRKIRGQSRRST